MPNWLSVILLIAVVIAVALLRETWRQRDINAFIATSGFTRLPSDSGWQATAAPLVALMHPSGARIWGTALSGTLDDVPVTIAEHESSRGVSQESRWYTLVVWPLREPAGGAVALTEASNTAVDAVVTAVSTLGTGVRLSEQLGITDPVPEANFPVRAGRFDVTADVEVRTRWLTDQQVAALDTLPADGRYARLGDHGAWRMEGTITKAMLQRIGADFDTVRRVLDSPR